MIYKILWGFDAFIAAIFVYFFLWGLLDGSVSSYNISLWIGILAFLGGILWGSARFHLSGKTGRACALLGAVAVPGALMGIFFLSIIILQPRWN